MLVRELIALLQTFPQDVPVLHTMMSDYVELDDESISVVHPLADGTGIACHNGHWMHIPSAWWPKDKPGRPLPQTVVHIEGN